jgi:hypothetical protein
MKRPLPRKHHAKYVLLALVAAVPIAFYFWYTREVDDVERAILQIGFDPLVPPNKALTLGSFYYVSLDGSRPRPVCSASAKAVEAMVETSPLPEVVASRLVDAHANMQASMLRTVKAQAAIEDQLEIQYSFKDTKLNQLNGADLVALENQLFGQTNCNAAIAEYINNVGLVCQVQSALLATVSYVIKRKDGRKLAEEDIEKIKGAIEATTDMQGMSVRESSVQGMSLFYGITFKPKCVTNADETSLVYPQSRSQRILLHARLLWRRMFS